MVLNKFDEFMHYLQHGHDVNEAHDSPYITQELIKISFHNFDNMEIIIHYHNRRFAICYVSYSKGQHIDLSNFYITKKFIPFYFQQLCMVTLFKVSIG
jgi:hypothetical protein